MPSITILIQLQRHIQMTKISFSCKSGNTIRFKLLFKIGSNDSKFLLPCCGVRFRGWHDIIQGMTWKPERNWGLIIMNIRSFILTLLCNKVWNLSGEALWLEVLGRYTVGDTEYGIYSLTLETMSVGSALYLSKWGWEGEANDSISPNGFPSLRLSPENLRIMDNFCPVICFLP